MERQAGRSGEKDAQRVTRSWDTLEGHLDGVTVHEVKNIVTRNGHTTELFREDWQLISGGSVKHMIHVALRDKAVSAWHLHKLQTDHIFVVSGMVRLVLFDSRSDSSTRGQVEVMNLSPMRPSLVVIPPAIWHGLQNLLGEESSFINFFDREYVYEDPDEWRLPADSSEVPYRFA